MKKLLGLLATAVLSFSLLTGCGGNNANDASGLSGTVSTNGSTSVERAVASLIEAFAEVSPGITVTYDATGSGAGINAAREGNADIGLSSRLLRSSEIEEGLGSVVFAIDAIAIIINPENTVEDLTIDQIAALYTGEFTNWNEVGGPDAPVALIGREAGSGTRDGFESIINVVDKCAYDQELNSGGAIIAAVASNPYAIGYASLSAVRDNVKVVTVNSVECTEDTILTGDYAVQRPFIFVLNKSNELSEAAQAFIDFAISEDAREIIQNAGVIQPRRSAPVSGTVSTNGSTSVERTVSSLIEAFTIFNPDAVITYDATGSGAGINAAREGNADIGLSSRGLRDSEIEEGLESIVFAIDAIAVIVNPENTVEDLTIEQIAAFYTGEITNWNEVGGPDAPVALIGREAGSGTRDGFESIMNIVDKCAYDQELNSGGAIIAAVASNPYAIGYASLSAVRDTVNVVTVNGVECTESNIVNGTYEVQRPFIFVLNSERELSEAAQAFINFARSEEARSFIHNAGVIQPR